MRPDYNYQFNSDDFLRLWAASQQTEGAQKFLTFKYSTLSLSNLPPVWGKLWHGILKINRDQKAETRERQEQES